MLETTGHKSRRRSTSFGFLVFPQTRPNPSWAACNWARKATLHFLISASSVGLSAKELPLKLQIKQILKVEKELVPELRDLLLQLNIGPGLFTFYFVKTGKYQNQKDDQCYYIVTSPITNLSYVFKFSLSSCAKCTFDIS